MDTHVSFDDWLKVEMKVAKIVGVEKVPNRDKLYKIQVELGEKEPRQIISGLVPYYTPEELMDRKIIVVSNLTPATIAGQQSNGMLVGAENSEGKFVLLSVSEDIEVGSMVK